MKTTKAASSSVDGGNLSIPAAEEIIEDALNELAYSPDPGMVRALRFLAPPGYQAIVELCSENGRSKRRNASATAWSPEEDEVRIYFERIDGAELAPRPARVSRVAAPASFDDEIDDGPLFHTDTLRAPGAARREDHIGQVAAAPGPQRRH